MIFNNLNLELNWQLEIVLTFYLWHYLIQEKQKLVCEVSFGLPLKSCQSIVFLNLPDFVLKV